MKIAVLGAGALGLLFGGYLSQENEVYLVCTNESKANCINQNGLEITQKDGTVRTFHPTAVVDTAHLGAMDVVILLTKAGNSRSALDAHKDLLGDQTFLMTLQNGAGHEGVLQDYVGIDHVVVGITQDGSMMTAPNAITHTGVGHTYFSRVAGVQLPELAQTFVNCGFDTTNVADMGYYIWDKLLINATSSVLSAVLGMPQGYCFANKAAWDIMGKLVAELVAVTTAQGLDFDYESQMARLERHLTGAPEGRPSIMVDVQNGRVTEVDTISGFVVNQGRCLKVPTPTHEMMVNLVHALEGRTN